MSDDPFQRLLDYFEGNQSAIARAVGVTPQSVSSWFARESVPLHHALRLERITGGVVTHDEFHPEIYEGLDDVSTGT